MFTGIIEEIGTLKSVKKGVHSSVLTICANKVLDGTKIGDSIAVSGVCLTVTSMDKNSFQADTMAETLRRSGLGQLKPGDPVNLERALAAGDRMGGHIVTGHIDGLGTIVSYTKEDNATWIKIRASFELMRYIVEKGSIAIDGVSLTVVETGNDFFSVSLIPHTGEETILLRKKPGDSVNLECDIIGKYVEKLLEIQPEESIQKGITLNFLQENGF